MTDGTGPGLGIDDVVEAVPSSIVGKGRRWLRLLVLLLVLFLCVITMVIDVLVLRTPQQIAFISRNLECLECHSDLIPALSLASVHDPFLKDDCTTCHTKHGEEVIEVVTSGGWRRWERLRTLIEWLPLKIVREAIETSPNVDVTEGGGIVSETTTRTKGPDSVLTVDRTRLCWVCHGDLAMEKIPLAHQHSPFEKGFCTDCHDPHASEVRVLLRREEEELCPSCHPMFDELARDQLHPPYEGRYCTNCHDPHASDWSGVLVDNQRDLCFVCHPSVAPLSLKPVQHNPFLYDNCTGCHEPHASDNLPLLIADQPPLCYLCHPEIEDDFDDVSRHPVWSTELDCSDCHDPHAADYAALLAAQGNVMCYQCHDEARGDSAAIMASYDVSPHRDMLCVDCHTPHGSPYVPILRQGNPDLCLGCHPDYEGPNKHPVRPIYYDIVARTGLTCSSTCHNPHGSPYMAMLNYQWPRDEICLACHPGVGIDF